MTSINFQEIQRQFVTASQSREEPWTWPVWPKNVLFILTGAFVFFLLWYLLLRGQGEDLEAERAREQTLRTDFETRLNQAKNLEGLKAQKEEVLTYVKELDKQLPTEGEVDALLSQINQAGVESGLQFELFRPGKTELKVYFAELPVDLKVNGRYHSMGEFTARLAALSRIVTINEIKVEPMPKREDQLTLQAKLKTYRFLTPAEIAEVDRIQAEKAKAQGAQQ